MPGADLPRLLGGQAVLAHTGREQCAFLRLVAGLLGVGYDDLAPYYDKVEMLIGVFGTNEGLENSPDSSPGTGMAPPNT